MLHNNQILVSALEQKGYDNSLAYAYLVGAMSVYLTDEQHKTILKTIEGLS